MKRLWASAVILVVTLTLCWLGIITTLNHSTHLSEALEQAQAAVESGDIATAIQLSEQAESDWRDSHQIMCTYIPHTRLESLDMSLSTLAPLLRHGALDEFSAERARASAQIASLRETELPTLQNIL